MVRVSTFLPLYGDFRAQNISRFHKAEEII